MPVFNKMVYNGTEYILGGGGNIGEPLNLTVTTSRLNATITWEDNEIGTIPPTSFVKSELVREIGSAPTSPSDGDLVVTETVKDTYKVSGYVDSGLTDGETYYYRVFSYSDLGGISYCDAVSVTPSNQRQPGVNTIAYYPLTSTSTVNDMSGNSNTLTNNSGVTFGVNAGVNCASFDGSNYLNITGLLDYTQLNGCTMCAWFYVVQYPTGSDGKVIATDGSTSIMFAKWLSPSQYYMEIAGGTGTGVTTIGEWTLGMISSDGTNNILALKSSNIDYTNSSITANRSSLGSSFSIGAQPSGNGKLIGYVSNVILEDKKWSVQDFLDYYNQTKGDYGIS